MQSWREPRFEYQRRCLDLKVARVTAKFGATMLVPLTAMLGLPDSCLRKDQASRRVVAQPKLAKDPRLGQVRWSSLGVAERMIMLMCSSQRISLRAGTLMTSFLICLLVCQK